MLYFMPSCNFRKQFPEASDFINEYAAKAYGAKVLGCCRVMLKDPSFLKPGDTVLTICQNCAIMIHEQLSHLPCSVEDRSIFELLAEDENFPWPDLQGEIYTLQDCGRAQDKPQLQEAVRRCLSRMNLSIVELPEEARGANSRFCGTFFMDGPNPANLALSPAYYREVYPVFAKELETAYPAESIEAAKSKYMEAQVALLPTEKVVGYCNRCVSSLRAEGVNAVHLMELMMSQRGPEE